MGLRRSGWFGVVVCCLVAAARAVPDLDAALRYADSRRDAYVSELSEIVALPSVSAQPERLPDLLKAADWVKARLETAGLQNVQILETTGPRPAVYAEHISDADGPTILIYGHYDVQPAEPLEKWTSPAFDLTERDGRLYGRGASDDKGGILGAIQAKQGVEAVLRSGGLGRLNIKFLVEGEEEVLSPHLEAFLQKHAELLRADAAYSADGGQVGLDRPSLTLGYRGAVGMEVAVSTLAHDVHSGMYGGAVQNAVRALVELLGTLFDPEGRIAVEGFYDGVRPMSPEDAADVEAYGFDEESELVQGVGALAAHGESGFPPLARLWFRPTLEIVGIYGGYTGNGLKTIVPAAATAKLAARLAADQDPATVLARVKAHLHAHAPLACNLTVRDMGFSAMPYVADRRSRWVRAAAAVLETLTGAAPVYDRSGATIPALAAFRRHLGIDTVSFAFSLREDAAHAPDESFARVAYDRARDAYIRLLHALDGPDFDDDGVGEEAVVETRARQEGADAHEGAGADGHGAGRKGELHGADTEHEEELFHHTTSTDEAEEEVGWHEGAYNDVLADEEQHDEGFVYEEEAWEMVPEQADELGGDWMETAYEHEEL